MSRDPNERAHRRTWRNPGCMAVMAGADFTAVPSLAEAMGLTEETPMRTTTADRKAAEQLKADPAYAGLTVAQIADLRQRGFAGKFPELSDTANATIFEARAKGFDACFPAFPTAKAQAERTYRAAFHYLDNLKRVPADQTDGTGLDEHPNCPGCPGCM